MKKIASFILIGAFLFPVLGHAAAAPQQTQAISPATPPAAIEITATDAGFRDVLAKLSDLAKRTQIAMDQLGSNGIDTTDAQESLTAAKASLLKAKNTLATPKYSAKTAESQILEGRTGILQSLILLKASLSAIN